MCNEVLTILPTLLITVSKEDIKELSVEEQQMLRNNTEMMRTNEEVMMIYLENLFWKRYKQTMVGNVISDKFDHKNLDEPEIPEYHHSEHFSDFMMSNGCYVFSGAGLRFPEILDENPKNPYDVEEQKKTVAFGKSYKPVKYQIEEAKKKALAKLGHKDSKSSKPQFKY
jgi:hypothetical protein